MIRLAKLSDVEEIMRIVTAVCQEMHKDGNEQWDDNYPQAVDFIQDIQQSELHIYETDGQISGFICINYIEPDEYARIVWSSNQKPMVLHRMAVAPDYQGRGIASKLFRFAEELAQKSGVHYLRSDTNSMNEKMNALFKKMGYAFVGQMPAFGKISLFNFYDKVL